MTPYLLGLLCAAGLGAALVNVLALLRRPAVVVATPADGADMNLLTAGLAHEIKNPLSTLQLNLQLLGEDLADQSLASRDPAHQAAAAKMGRRLDSVHKEVGRLREILDDFLRYAGRLEPDVRPLDLAPALEELVDFLAPQAQAAHVRLSLDQPPDELPPVRADSKLVKQAVLNLLLNAIQHTDAGGRVTLRVAAERGKTRKATGVRVAVRDTGRGIAPDQRERVFEPYFSRRKGGTGLGLPLTRRIVEAHGGALTLDSELGRGSTFAFTLPAADPGVAGGA